MPGSWHWEIRGMGSPPAFVVDACQNGSAARFRFTQVHDFSISKKQMHTELAAEATRLIAQLLALDCRAAGEPS
jgi:hypothetical protein